jgi:hypothetical protein
MANTISFPAIALSVGDSFLVVNELSAITSCTLSALHHGYYRRFSLFDTEGVLWPVKEAIPERPVNILDRLTDRVIRVTLDFDVPMQGEMSLIVEELCRLIDNDPDDLYDQFLSHEELKARIRGCRSAGDLVHLADTLGEI